MDPQMTFQMLLDAYQSRDWVAVEELGESLLSWLAGGGFPPRLDALSPERTQLVVQLFCSQVLAAIPEHER